MFQDKVHTFPLKMSTSAREKGGKHKFLTMLGFWQRKTEPRCFIIQMPEGGESGTRDSRFCSGLEHCQGYELGNI